MRATETFLKYNLQPKYIILRFLKLLHLSPLRFLCFEDVENEPWTAPLVVNVLTTQLESVHSTELKICLVIIYMGVKLERSYKSTLKVFPVLFENRDDWL
jgi:hypothetical protein